MMKRMAITTWATVWYYKEELIELAIIGALLVGSLFGTYRLGYLHGMYGY